MNAAQVVEEAKALTPSHWMNKKVSVEPRKRFELASRASSGLEQQAEIKWTSEEAR